MNSADFWASIRAIINENFKPEGLQKMYSYAEQFINEELVYKRFSPIEQHGCAMGGVAHVIASILAGAENGSNCKIENGLTDIERERQQGAEQESYIERWAKAVDIWFDNVEDKLEKELGGQIAEGGEAHVYDSGTNLVKSIGLDYFIQPIFALDRISLHNAYFPETKLTVLGFGRNRGGEFQIIVEQPFVIGRHMDDYEIAFYIEQLGFELKNARNWTYCTPEIYLSDLHDENVIRSSSGSVFVVDCDIRINTPELRQGGVRKLINDVEFV